MLTEAISVALITGAAAVIGQWLISRNARQKDTISAAKSQQKLDDRLAIIDQKIEIHNNYAEKFTEVTTDIVKIQKDIEYLKEKFDSR